MPKCRQCQTEFHYCGSCGFDEIMSCGYCSEKCLQKGESEDINRIVEFFGKLSSEDRKMVYEIIDEIPEITIQLAMKQFDDVSLDQSEMDSLTRELDGLCHD